jgi:predicted O-methyltransferase YrrM
MPLRLQRASELRSKRGFGWLLRSTLAELPLLPGAILKAVNVATRLNFTNKLIGLAGIHTDQLWAERRAVLQSLAATSLMRPADVLEVGSWFGTGSTRVWLSSLKSGSSLTVIDSWKSYITEADKKTGIASTVRMDAVHQHAIMSTLRQIFRRESVRDDIRISLIRADSAAFLPTLKDGLFDLIYLDGSHYYEGVKRDIQQAIRLVRPGGIIAGDDMELQPTPELVEIARTNLDKDLVLLEGGRAFHPGVMLAVHEMLGTVRSDQGTWWKTM